MAIEKDKIPSGDAATEFPEAVAQILHDGLRALRAEMLRTLELGMGAGRLELTFIVRGNPISVDCSAVETTGEHNAIPLFSVHVPLSPVRENFVN